MNESRGIPHICHFVYTTAIRCQEVLNLKVRKFATRVDSQQNSVDYHSKTQIMNCLKTMIRMLNFTM